MPPQRRCILGAATLKTVCKVAVLGFGTVGRSVSRILARRAPGNLRLTYVCNRNVARKKVDWLPPEVQWTEDFSRVLSSDVDVVVELVGGLEAAGDWIRSALLAGKSVVTANKQLMAHCGSELIGLALGWFLIEPFAVREQVFPSKWVFFPERFRRDQPHRAFFIRCVGK